MSQAAYFHYGTIKTELRKKKTLIQAEMAESTAQSGPTE